MRYWLSRGVEIYGIGLMHDASGVFGRDRHVLVRSLSDVSAAGLRQLVDALNPAVRRRA